MERWKALRLARGFFFLGEIMGDILKSARAYEKLLDVEYQFILGRKKKNIMLTVSFDALNFFHLAGFQYLEDMPDILRSRRDIVFYKILNEIITTKQISSSHFYPLIKDRIEYLEFLEFIFDSNKTIFKYNPKTQAFSVIESEFLLKNEVNSRNVFTFLSEDKSSGKYFCRSFFPQTDKDYSLGQTSWTLLYKKKIYKSTQSETVLYDKINKNC